MTQHEAPREEVRFFLLVIKKIYSTYEAKAKENMLQVRLQQRVH
jgi:hypothetical protein